MSDLADVAAKFKPKTALSGPVADSALAAPRTDRPPEKSARLRGGTPPDFTGASRSRTRSGPPQNASTRGGPAKISRSRGGSDTALTGLDMAPSIQRFDAECCDTGNIIAPAPEGELCTKIWVLRNSGFAQWPAKTRVSLWFLLDD